MAGPELPVALALGFAAALFAPTVGLSYGLLAAVVLAAGAWISGLFREIPDRTPFDLAFVATLVFVWTWLAPLSGWSIG